MNEYMRECKKKKKENRPGKNGEKRQQAITQG